MQLIAGEHVNNLIMDGVNFQSLVSRFDIYICKNSTTRPQYLSMWNDVYAVQLSPFLSFSALILLFMEHSILMKAC